MEVTRLALVALATTLLCFSAVLESTSGAPSSIRVVRELDSGSGDESTSQPTQEEGFVITTADSRPIGKPIKLSNNNATLIPVKDEVQEVQKWRISCPETRSNERLKLVFLLLHANLVTGDFLQFNKIRYAGYKSTPTVIDFDLGRETLLVSHITQEGKSDFDLRYVCPYSNFENCKDFHNCQAVVNYIAERPAAYKSLANLCYNPVAIHDGDKDPMLCEILKKASTCNLSVPHPLPCE